MSHLPADTAWLNLQEVCQVFGALEARRPGGSRFVGGCVRNTLMARPVDDIDIATQLRPEETIEALEASDIRAIPTGLEHGTITAVVEGMPFEITSLRRDVETDGRRAIVAFTDDWAEDAERRDFRLNAIYADLDGKLYDLTGGGVEDAAAGRVIFIGDADQRLREDYLRILRFFRFNAWYGAQIDAEGLAACARQKDGLRQIAAERIWKELKKLLSAPEPEDAIEAMSKSGVLGIVLPEASKDAVRYSLKFAVSAQLGTALESHPLRRLMALIPRNADAVRIITQRFRLSNSESERLSRWIHVNLVSGGLFDMTSLRAEIYRSGFEAVLDYGISIGEEGVILGCYNVENNWPSGPPVFPLKGEDLVKVGMKPGPAIGILLRQLEDWWIEGDFNADKAELLEELERRLKAD